MRVPIPHEHLRVLRVFDDLFSYGDPMFYQSSPGQTDQLMGITTRTLAWEMFYGSFMYRVQVSGVSIMNY